ncbi:coiled-coil domain-containing protein [Terriglobus aquaticus]|uniref:Uncharacterized protein n=1 Tax=Terriglobus aquaticus TaxID=940139 RepID=A0ABW9KI17_9BACT|nr:hypothetical protein [Terriglobus aquaticus]
MAAPVWVLSVDLQTKTAAFTTGLNDAAQKARGSFKDIAGGAKDMGDGVAQSSVNVRAALGLFDNSIRGNHAAAMADMIREFQNTKLVMMALPFAATAGAFIALGGVAVELVEHFKKVREEHEKLTSVQTEFGTAANNAYRSLDDKMLQAEKRADELKNDHLGALRAELKLIDSQSMAELMHQFEGVEKIADEVFSHLQGHWYTIGKGPEGAKHALDDFSVHYRNLLSQGKSEEASGLLSGTLQQARSVLALQQQAASTSSGWGKQTDDSKFMEHQAALNKLKQYGIGFDKEDLEAQQQLIDTLQTQTTIQQKISALKGQEGSNATRETGNEASARASEAAKQAAATRQAIAEQQLAGDRALANAQLDLSNATVQQRLASDLGFAQRELDIKLKANAEQAAALDKSGKDYTNQLAHVHEEAEVLVAQHTAQVAELTSRASVEQNRKDIADLEAAERAKIAATSQGSTARLAAIDQAMQTARQHALQETDFYRSLGSERVEVGRQIAEQTAKVQAELGKEAAENQQKMSELALDAELERQAVLNSSRRQTEAQQINQQLQTANEMYALKQTALSQELSALDKSGKDYEVKLKQILDRQKQLQQQHENEVDQVRNQAEIQRNQRIIAAEQSAANTIANTLTGLATKHLTFAQILESTTQQAASSLIHLAIASLDANGRTKISESAAAARSAFLSTMKAFPAPVNLIAAPLAGAAAFSSMMAFASGTDSVPGQGNGDTVPAMLTPGEGVVPKGVMEGLRNVARNGGFDQGGGHTYHVHVRPTYHLQALDGDGIETTLNKHTDVLQKHFETAVRRMNR